MAEELCRVKWAGHGGNGQELLDRIVSGLFQAGLSLQASMNGNGDADRTRVLEAIGQLDELISQIRDQAFATRHSLSLFRYSRLEYAS